MICAKLEHCTCMVDLLGHASHFEVVNMIKQIPCKTYAAAYKAFPGTCRIHGNVEMGEVLLNEQLFSGEFHCGHVCKVGE